MTKYIIYNKISKTLFARENKDGIEKYGFYKYPKNVIVFKDLAEANFMVQVLYDMKGYKSLVVLETNSD